MNSTKILLLLEVIMVDIEKKPVVSIEERYQQEIEKLEKTESELKEQIAKKKAAIKSIESSVIKKWFFKQIGYDVTARASLTILTEEIQEVQNELASKRRSRNSLLEISRVSENERKELQAITKNFDSLHKAIGKLCNKLIVFRKTDRPDELEIANIKRRLEFLQNEREKSFADKLQEIKGWDSHQMALEIQLCKRNIDDLPSEVKEADKRQSMPKEFHLLVDEKQFLEEYIIRLGQALQQLPDD